MDLKTQSRYADFGLLVAAVLWGGGFLASKIALGGFAPLQILSIRFFSAAVLLCILFRKKIFPLNHAVMVSGAVLGGLQVIGTGIQLSGLNLTTPGKQAFLIASYTVMVPFISWCMLKHRPDGQAFLAGLMVLGGVALLSLNEQFTIAFGDLLSLAAAFFFAVQIVLTGKFARSVDPLQLSFMQFLTAGIISLLPALAIDGLPSGIAREAWGGLLYLILFNTVIAFTIQNVAQKYTSDTRAAILISLESVFGFLFSVLLLHEVFTLRMLFGCNLIFAAVLISRSKPFFRRYKT